MYVKYVLSLTKFSNISSLEIFLQQTEFLSDILPFYQHRTESLLSYLTVYQHRTESLLSYLTVYQHQNESVLSDRTVLSAPDWICVITSYSFIFTKLNLCYQI